MVILSKAIFRYISIIHTLIKNTLYFGRLETQKTINISYKTIRYIRADIRSLGRNFAENVVLKMKRSGGKFWCVIKEKGGITIYDSRFGVFFNDPLNSNENDISKDEFNSDMVMVERGSQIKIYGRGVSFFNRRIGTNELIPKFINTRYNLALTSK